MQSRGWRRTRHNTGSNRQDNTQQHRGRHSDQYACHTKNRRLTPITKQTNAHTYTNAHHNTGISDNTQNRANANTDANAQTKATQRLTVRPPTRTNSTETHTKATGNPSKQNRAHATTITNSINTIAILPPS